MKESQFSAF